MRYTWFCSVYALGVRVYRGILSSAKFTARDDPIFGADLPAVEAVNAPFRSLCFQARGASMSLPFSCRCQLSASLAAGTTLKARHSPHLINIWLSTTKRSAVDDRDQPANTTVPHAPQTRSSLSFPIGNSKRWRALRSIIDAAGWGMPTARSLVCVRIMAESLRQERPILQIEKPWARLQVPVTGQRST